MTPDDIVILSAGIVVFIMFVILGFFWLRDPDRLDKKC